MNKIQIFSSAKINLDLIIKEKRDDNYHEISSVIQPVGLQDNIIIEASSSSKLIELDFSGPEIPIDDNLILKAAESFCNTFSIKQSIKISVKKNIPLGSGMGGGSSNAAAILLGLSRFFRLHEKYGSRLTHEVLVMAKKLGSDVTFFLDSRTAKVSGRGDIVDIIKNPPKLRYLLIFPGFKSRTKDLYALWDKEHANNKNSLEQSAARKICFNNQDLYLKNDFLPILVKRHQQYRNIFKILDDFGFPSYSISGSGSTIFVVLEDELNAKDAKEYLESHADVKVVRADSVEGWRFLVD